jgi:flagellar motor switch protein FliN/FliY
MTAAPEAPRPAEAEVFARVWGEALAQVLGQITTAPVPWVLLHAAPPELPPAAAADLWMVVTCSGGLRGEMSLRLNPAVVLGFAQVFMGEPAAPQAELTAEHREAGLELFRQVAGLAASALKPQRGEVQLRLDVSPGAPSWPASSTSWLQAGKDQTADALVELHLSAALAAALRQDKEKEKERDQDKEPDSAAGSATASASAHPPPSPAAGGGNQLALLMDVELAMNLRFGGRRLLLREILDLCPGTVVELDRQVKDPVELILDGRLVARGEVVVIDGNYGLRVTEVVAARAN